MSITVMKLALWALELDAYGEPPRPERNAAIAALRTAIAEAEKQEPVAWMDEFGNVFPLGAQRGPKYLNEPMKPLYTTPPAQSAPVQEPVTEAQKRADFERFWVTEIGDKDDLTYGGLGYAINRVAVAWKAWKAAAQPAQPAPVQEPVAIALNTGTKQGVKWLKNVEHGESLYTTPPAQPAPVQEPVPDEDELSNGLAFALHDAVLIRIGNDDEATRQAIARIDKLVAKYTSDATPPAQPAPEFVCSTGLCHYKAQRQPLTDEAIWRQYQALWPFHPAEEPRLAADMVTFARAIEAAHGIKENT